ncbi:hypothetical protein LSH36_330g00012, partial [Paralvinella palmiformis]
VGLCVQEVSPSCLTEEDEAVVVVLVTKITTCGDCIRGLEYLLDEKLCPNPVCHKCIRQSLEVDNRCPKCNFNIEKKDDIFPNILLNELILKQKQKQQEQKKLKIERQNGITTAHELFSDQESLDLCEVSHLLDLLTRRKEQLEAECKAVQHQMLKDFLLQIRKKKQEQLDQLSKELHLIDSDLERVEEGSVHNGFESTLSCSSDISPCIQTSTSQDGFNRSTNVSAIIEFDRDCDYFAIAGVTKKIKVFEYGTVIRDQVDMHYPILEMLCNSKISSIVWSSYHKGMLASADYEGTVTLWDAFTGSKSRMFQEHEKRCWSLDFNKMDPKLLASGSDDSRVKLWYTNMEHSVASIEAKANVCCVQFNPQSRYHLAFGSADHSVHYYDLRNTKQQLGVFKGHRKAVSYTKFVSSSEIVSASTDSQLKLWNLNKSHCLRTFCGHTNEKNFVGLATDGDYVACGSENNSLYVYYKGLSKQLMTFKFEPVQSVLVSVNVGHCVSLTTSFMGSVSL